MPDYANGKIYRIVMGDKYYIGATTLTLAQRFANHRQDMNRTSEFYAKVREHGINNCVIALVENVPCDSREQLGAREQFYIAQSAGDPNCLNRRAGHRSQTEKQQYAKDWAKQKTECPCGKTVARANMANHRRSKAHLQAMGEQ